MSRFYKSKRGFTLVEMVIVIAIIVILAAVVTISVSGYLTRGHEKSDSLANERATFQSDNAAKNAAFVAAGF